MVGDGVKIPSKSERKNIPIARKSIVAKKHIKKGEKFNVNNLAVKRPGTGISPIYWDSLINSIANRDYSEDELIEFT